ncbi:XAP5, circadian clock regulator-domain-containing protein [Dipodascopsis tothii]|uniref:XAP5, circadian clock regulator-domain-containing protein n=1 Tax=Dipodascopsis tothii TaxID=44089 RepID=UPI0034CE9129
MSKPTKKTRAGRPKPVVTHEEQLIARAAESSSSRREFRAQSTETADDLVKQRTIGLLTSAELQQLRDEAVAAADGDRPAPPARAGARKRRRPAGVRLSFGSDEEDGREGDGRRQLRPVRDPTVDTSFIRPRTAAGWEATERQALEKEFKEKQAQARAEPLTLAYLYFDGNTTAGTVETRKGETVGTVLERARKAHRALQRGTVDDVLLVRDGLILPHHYELFYFEAHAIRTRTGPLAFGVGDQVRQPSSALTQADRTKIVPRDWYERNKHIYPTSVWQEFDPDTDYTRAVLRDANGFVYFQQAGV